MIACWVFAGITLAAVLVATFVGDLRRAVLALWVAGLGIGAIYLTLGAEVLALVQWIVSTLVAISFVFFSAMFGEYGPGDGVKIDRHMIKSVLGVLVGGAFAWTIWVGAEGLPDGQLGTVVEGTDISAIGRAITGQHLLSLEVLALTLFLVLVGGGVLARPDAPGEGEESKEGAPS
jgi:NADH:ubiquinone oxidoreductase subunit 6 (subunit J)